MLTPDTRLLIDHCLRSLQINSQEHSKSANAEPIALDNYNNNLKSIDTVLLGVHSGCRTPLAIVLQSQIRIIRSPVVVKAFTASRVRCQQGFAIAIHIF